MSNPATQHTTFVVGLSGGLGQSMAHEMIKHSFTVHGSYKNNPTEAAKFKLDIADTLSVDSLARLFLNRKTQFDSLVINSGISMLGPQLSISSEDYKRSFDVNFFGPRQVIKAFLPTLKPDAKIILIGSSSAWGALPFTGAYSLSKRLLRDFWNILRQEMILDPKTSKMKLIFIEPGGYKTGIWKDGTSTMEKNLGKNKKASMLISNFIKNASDPAPFGRKIVKILNARFPCSYYRFGPMSHISRASEWLPIGVRTFVIRVMRLFGFEFHSS